MFLSGDQMCKPEMETKINTELIRLNSKGIKLYEKSFGGVVVKGYVSMSTEC